MTTKEWITLAGFITVAVIGIATVMYKLIRLDHDEDGKGGGGHGEHGAHGGHH